MNKLTPLMQVRTAKSLWLLTLYICNGIEKGKIPHELFSETLKLTSGGKEIVTIHPIWKEGVLDDLTHNLKQGVVGICCVAFDSALDEVLGAKPQQYSDSDIDALRAIIYMIRCAFAHEPTSPKWLVKQKYRRAFRINEIGLEADFSKLNGQVASHDHYGGWGGLFKLFDYCEKVVIEHSSDKV